MQKASVILFASAATLSALCSGPAIHAQTAPAAAKPAPISCTIRHAPASPGDNALLSGDLDGATTLYRTESKVAGEEGERTHNALIRTLIVARKFSEAETDARAWAASAPQDAWAKTSLGEVQLGLDEIDDAGVSMRAAIGLSFCNAQAHADYAQYLDFAGYHAGAKTQIEIAHKLDSVDSDITARWIRLQPTGSRSKAIDAYLDRSKSLSVQQRKAWEDERNDPATSATTPCSQSTSLGSATLPLYAIRDGSKTGGAASNVVWGLVVTINGKRRRLQLDTAASGIVLKKGSATGLDLKEEGRGVTQGFGNQAGMATMISSGTIKVGDMEFQRCPIQTLETDTLAETWGAARHFMEGQDGLIGIDVFRDFLLTIDYPGKLFKLAPLPRPPGAAGTDAALASSGNDQIAQDRYTDASMAAWTKAFRYGNQLFVPVRANGGPPRLFLLDTGIPSDMISTARARQITSVEKGNALQNANQGQPTIVSDVGEVIGAGGISDELKQTHATGAIALEFGGLRQPPHEMLAFDSGLFLDNIEIAGALGGITLRQLTIQIDARDQLVKFTYDPSRLAHCIQNVTIDDCY